MDWCDDSESSLVLVPRRPLRQRNVEYSNVEYSNVEYSNVENSNVENSNSEIQSGIEKISADIINSLQRDSMDTELMERLKNDLKDYFTYLSDPTHKIRLDAIRDLRKEVTEQLDKCLSDARSKGYDTDIEKVYFEVESKFTNYFTHGIYRSVLLKIIKKTREDLQQRKISVKTKDVVKLEKQLEKANEKNNHLERELKKTNEKNSELEKDLKETKKEMGEVKDLVNQFFEMLRMQNPNREISLTNFNRPALE